MLVLSLLENENMYGYQMIKELSRKSKELFELKEGTLYPKHLKEKKEEWECFSNGINQVLGGVLFGY